VITFEDQEIDMGSTHPTWSKRQLQLNELMKSEHLQKQACACGVREYSWRGYNYLSRINYNAYHFPIITEEQVSAAFE
jgi:hypothetical protein